jgi:Ni/Co efflux regulator RcnB
LIALVSALVLLLAAAPLQSVQAADELQQFQQRMAQLFRQLDRNGDGRLDRDEARANAYLQRHFDRLDRGDKGYLVPGDLR